MRIKKKKMALLQYSGVIDMDDFLGAESVSYLHPLRHIYPPPYSRFRLAPYLVPRFSGSTGQ